MCNIIAGALWFIIASILVIAIYYSFISALRRRLGRKRALIAYLLLVLVTVAAFTIFLCARDADFSDMVRPMGMLALTVFIGGGLVWVCCKACVKMGRRFRLWLHRKISRMSSLFAIIACGMVICGPLVAALVLSHAAYGVSNFDMSGEILKGYFYAIYSDDDQKSVFSADGANNLSSNIAYVRLLFGLIGYLIFSGFTVSLFVEMVRAKKDRIEQGEEYYTSLTNHYVVIGSGALLETVLNEIEKSQKKEKCSKYANPATLTDSFSNKIRRAAEKAGIALKKICNIPDYDVVILSSEPILELRKRLSAKLSEDKMEPIIFIHGDRTNPDDLRQLCLPTCKEIYLTGDSRGIDMDDHNLESLVHIDSILKAKTCGIKKCSIYLDRYQTYSLFQGFIKDTKLGKLDVEPVCFYKHWAEVVLGVRSNIYNINYPHMDGKGIGVDADKHMHLVVIGMSRMGMSLVTEAAMLLHFPNSHKKRTRITMIDLNAQQEMDKYINMHQALFDAAYYTYSEYSDNPFDGTSVRTQEYNRETGWLDTEFHFVRGNAESRSVRELLTSFVQEDINLTVAICLPDARQSLSLSLSLPRDLYNRPDVSILVQQEVGAGMLNLLSKQSFEIPHYKNILPFGMLNENVGAYSEVDDLAPFASMTYISGCTDLYRSDMLLDIVRNPKNFREKMEAWAKMQPLERISNRYAAASRKYKLRSIGLDDSADHVDIESLIYGEKYSAELFGELEHNRWCVEKLLVGFRTLTPAEQEMVDSYPIGSSQRDEKIRELKTREFAHVGIRPWREICSNLAYREFYLNSINMGRAICLLSEMKKAADETERNSQLH